jgi:uncharacterized protein YbaR (Trm112 family)
MDFEVQRCTRHCAITGRQLLEGEDFYSVLAAEGAAVERQDYSLEAWQGPPEGALGWWKSKIPTREAKKHRLAPSEVLLQLFQGLEAAADKQDMRYVLALLLIRRRILRLEDTETDERKQETLVLYCPRDETTYRIRSELPSDERTKEIQEELARLLQAGAEVK